MAIITSGAYALSLAAARTDWLPVILWQNLAGYSAYTADEAAPGYPASNLSSPSTVEGWRGMSTDPQTVVMTLEPSAPVAAAGIARHNHGSGTAAIKLEGVAAGDDPEEPGDWFEIIPAHVPADDGPILYRFAPVHLEALRLSITPVSTVPRMAVFWAGPLLTMERGVQPDTPIGWGLRQEVQAGRNSAGDFLGRTIVGGTRQAAAQFQRLTKEWVRSKPWRDFVVAAADTPFFFAWSPYDYPHEVGFCWARNDLVATPSHIAGYADVTIEMEGIV